MPILVTQAQVHGPPSWWGALCWGQIEVCIFTGQKSLTSNAGHLGPNPQSFYLLYKPRGDETHSVSYSSTPVPQAATLHAQLKDF